MAETTINWGTVPDWIMVFVAVVAAVIALRQLRSAIEATAHSREATQAELEASARAAQDQAEIARADLILEIDRDFESAEMQEGRLALRALHNEIKAFVMQMDGARGWNNDQIHAKINEQFGGYLTTLWQDFKKPDTQATEKALEKMVERHVLRVNEHPDTVQPEERAGLHYQRLTRIFGWLERVAYMVNQGLLPKDDVVRLYDFVFVELGGWIDGHIQSRRTEGTLPNPDYMKETTQLRDEILKIWQDRKVAANTAAKGNHSPAQVFTNPVPPSPKKA